MADKKGLFQPQIKEKWLFGMEPLEPIPEGPHCKRWYRTKDKSPPNYLAKKRNRLLRYPMDSWRWTFMRDGQVDFRTGFPSANNMIICGPREGCLSTTAPRVPQPPPRKTQKKLPKEAELLSKLSPAQEAGKAFVEEMEAILTSDSSAHYPGLKESLPSGFFLTMLEETDPNKKLEDKWAYRESMKDRNKASTKLCEKHPEEINLEPSEPSQPGTSWPSQPGPPNQVNLGLPSYVNRDLLNRSTWHLLTNSTGDLLAKLTRVKQVNLPTRDLPAKLPWDQLVKSSWDLLAKSTMNSQPSQLVLPGQVNQGPPKQVKRGPPKQVNRRPPKQVNRGPPKKGNQGPPKKVNQGPPKKVNRGPPGQVNQGSSDQLNQGSPSQVTTGAPEQVDQKAPKESFLSYLMNSFPEEKKKKKSSRKGISKTPDPYRYAEDEDSEFCKWTDTFGDMSIDEKFTAEQFEIDDKCTPTRNMDKIKKVIQDPVELYYSKGLDDKKKGKFPLQDRDWEGKLRKPPYPYRPLWVNIRYGNWYLNRKTSKKQIKDEPWVGPKALKEQEYQRHGRDLEPDILDNLYGPIAFKDFIVSKGYRMPGVIEKLFLRKKWTYDSVKTPVVDQITKLLSKVPDDTSEDD